MSNSSEYHPLGDVNESEKIRYVLQKFRMKKYHLVRVGLIDRLLSSLYIPK